MASPLDRATVIILGVLILSSLYSAASSKEEGSAAIGLGTQTCAIFASRYRGNPTLTELAYGSWAEGFLAGLNFGDSTASRNVAASSSAEHFAILRQFCDSHPLALVMEGIMREFYSLPMLDAKP